MSSKSREDKRELSKVCGVICISNASSDEAKDSSYWWIATHEFVNKLIDLNYDQFGMTVDPKNKICRIMISYDNWPVDKDGNRTFSEDVLTEMIWDLQKEFDFFISCKLDAI